MSVIPGQTGASASDGQRRPRPQIDLGAGADDVLTSVEATAEAVRDRRVSAVEAVEECLRRVGSPEAEPLAAFITVDEEGARMEALRLDDELRRRGPVGPLHGVPIAVKDNLATRGLRTTGGTRLFGGWIPAEDAGVVAALRAAGAVIIGKTNLHEAAFGITCQNPFYGSVANPYDIDRIAGGSSGGSGAAVAANLCPAALGTDTGGSVRIPAALCGLVGLKPSIGRVSVSGLMSLSRTTDVIGPMAHSVRDAALIDGVLAGSRGNERLAEALPLKGLRVGVLGDYFADTDAETARLFRAFLENLERHGAVLSDAALAGSESVMGALFDIVLPESWLLISELLGAVYPGARLQDRLDQCSPQLCSILESEACVDGTNTGVSAVRYLEAVWRTRPQQELALGQALEIVDVLVCPSTPSAAVRREDDPGMVLNGQPVPTFETFIRHCLTASLAGTPALTIPIGLTNDGLPVGAQLMARFMEDRRLLRIGAACERALFN